MDEELVAEAGMQIDPNLPVIAIFGPNDVASEGSQAAAMLGAVVNDLGCLLLTGGVPPKDGYLRRPDPVKDAAIAGAMRGASPDHPARWVGVANREEADKADPYGETCGVVTPGWDDRRNFVEACLCDGAVAVVAPRSRHDGTSSVSQGTASEALFSVYLGRPLIVVADDPSPADLTPQALVGQARRRVQPSDPPRAVDRGIAGAYAWAGSSNVELPVRVLPEDEVAARRIVDELLSFIATHAPRRDFTDLADEEGWDRYVEEALRASGR
jgi:hypothetical protein